MRTTLDLDPDVLQIVKQVAAATGRSAGEAASELIRRGLTEPRNLQQRGSLLLFPKPLAGVTVTNDLIDRLSHDLP